LVVYCNGWIWKLEQPILRWSIYIYFWFRDNMNVYFTVGISHRGFVFLRKDWVFFYGCNVNLEHPLLRWIIFIYFCFRENRNVHFTVGGHHRGFVVLRNDCVFILIGLMDFRTSYSTVRFFLLFIFAFEKIWNFTSPLGVITEDSYFFLTIGCLL